MAIIRAAENFGGYTVITNELAQDPRLSMRGIGVLVRLLSRPANWRTNSELLAKEFNVGRDQVRNVLRELSEAGYMRLVKTRAPDGTISSHWYVYSASKTAPSVAPPDDLIDSAASGDIKPANQSAKPAPDSPSLGGSAKKPTSPGTGNPHFGSVGALKHYREETKDIPLPLHADGAKPLALEDKEKASGDASFEAFWQSWPKSPRKVDRKKCLAKWKRSKFADKVEAIIAHVETMKQSKQWREGYEPMPMTYLSGERWLDGNDGDQDSGALPQDGFL